MDYLKNCSNCRNEAITFCQVHPLNYGMVKMMNISWIFGSGLSWANIIEREENNRIMKMSEKERKEYEESIINKRKEQEQKSENDMKEYMLKKKSLFTDTTSGMAKKKFNKICKHQYEHGKLCAKFNSKEPSDTCSKENNCGCWPHKEIKGKCSFIHDDEKEEMKELFEKYKISEGHYLFLEKIIDNKAVYSKNGDENHFNTLHVNNSRW